MASRPAASTSSAASALSATPRSIAVAPATAAESGTRRSRPPPQQPPGDARRAARAACDFVGAIGGHGDAEYPCAAIDNKFKLAFRIKVEPHWNAETVAQRISQQPGPRGGADQRKFGEIDLYRASRRSGADNQIKLK